jgi:hypothetical protein
LAYSATQATIACPSISFSLMAVGDQARDHSVLVALFGTPTKQQFVLPHLIDEMV